MNTAPIKFDGFFDAISGTALNRHSAVLTDLLHHHYEKRPHGHQAEWDQYLKDMTAGRKPTGWEVEDGRVVIPHHERPLSAEQLRRYMPWRKGPWRIHGVDIDCEWRSDWKWDRLISHIDDLEHKRVLDVGCGNGYHLFRMLEAGAKIALGIDPTRLFLYQFALMQALSGETRAHILPLRSEHLPGLGCFDTVFSMGVLHHRRSPIDHLQELKGFLKPGGQLVLETLVINGDESRALVPPDTYASMSNIWFLPSAPALARWVDRLNFRDTHIVDVTTTTTEEQHRTEWMDFHSLPDFLSPSNPAKTIEGLPAPTRAILTARAPS